MSGSARPIPVAVAELEPTAVFDGSPSATTVRVLEDSDAGEGEGPLSINSVAVLSIAGSEDLVAAGLTISPTDVVCSEASIVFDGETVRDVSSSCATRSVGADRVNKDES